MHLTKRYIDAARYQGDGTGRDVRWDDDPRGFGLRLYPSGKKSFVLSYRHNGRKRLYVLGQYGTLTVDEARDLARKELAKVIDGGDPVADRREARRKAAGADSFADLARLYLERHARPNKKPRSVREDERILRRDLLPRWGRRPAAEIRRRDVIDLLDAISDRGAPIIANRTRALISKIYNFGIARDLVEANPAWQVKPPGKETARQRVYDDGELKALWGAFGRLGPFMAGMFKLRLLTLQRGGEVASMRWQDIDGDWWTIPPERSKNGLAHRVPLSPQAREVLDGLAEFRHASGWVFPSPTVPDQPIYNTGKAMVRIRESSAVADFRAHDLRRTGASRLTGMGFPRLTVAKLLNHAENGVTAVYDRHGYDAEKRKAADAWGRHVARLLSGEPAKVVELPKTG